MKKKFALIAAFALLLSGACKAASRIISLAPSITEILFAMGLEKDIAGVTRYCVYPPEAKQKPSVGGYVNPSLEAILALKPDAIFILSEHKDLEPSLTKLGIPVTRFDHSSIKGVLASMREMARIAGDPAAGEQLAAKLQTRIDQLAHAHAAGPHPHVLLGFDRLSGSDHLEMMVPGKGTIYSDLLVAAGGVNALENDHFQTLSTEAILRLDPDVVIIMATEAEGMPSRRKDTLGPWMKMKELKAVRNNRVYFLTGPELVVPGPRLLGVGEKMASLLDEKGQR